MVADGGRDLANRDLAFSYVYTCLGPNVAHYMNMIFSVPWYILTRIIIVTYNNV